MSTLADTARNSSHSGLGRWKPKEHQGESISESTTRPQQVYVSNAGAGRLEPKAFTLPRQRIDAFDHQPPGGKCTALFIERRKSARDVVRVDELPDSQRIGEQIFGRSRFARAIWSADDNQFFHTCFSAEGSCRL